jgi:uncharacterized protein YdaU (DUF1376 family)
MGDGIEARDAASARRAKAKGSSWRATRTRSLRAKRGRADRYGVTCSEKQAPMVAYRWW